MAIIKIKDSSYESDNLTYSDYKSLIKNGTPAHYKALTGKDVVEKKEPVKAIAEKEDKKAIATKEDKQKNETKV